jgi:hypothetical protein
LGNETRLDRVNVDFLESVLAGEAQVVATWLGLRGDSGCDDPSAYLFLRGRSRERLVASAARYAAAVASRRVVKGVLRPTLSDGTFLQTTAMALDHGRLLPPFLPMFRGEDVLFPFMLRAIRPEACIAYLPWTVLHEPVEPRSFPAGGIAAAAERAELVQILLAIVHGARPLSATEPAARLRALGEMLTAYADASSQRFAERLRQTASRIAEGCIERCERELAAHGDAPSYWAADVDAFMQALRARLLREDVIVLREYRAERDLGAAVERTRADVARVGALFSAWPAIWEAARALRRRGVRLTRPA